MVLLFKTVDDKDVQVDLDNLTWTMGEEGGDLIPQGFGSFGLNPRTPKDGVSVIMVVPNIRGNSIVIQLRANAEIKDFMLKEIPSAVLYEIVPALPGLENRTAPRMEPVSGKPGTFKTTAKVSIPAKV